jgi:hypothetical protein
MSQKENHKYIFLDIDGVLNTLNGNYKRFCGVNIIEEKLLLLKRLVDATNAEIVLSSSWRNYPTSREDVKKVLGAVGLSYKDCTPDFEGEKTRGGEISA